MQIKTRLHKNTSYFTASFSGKLRFCFWLIFGDMRFLFGLFLLWTFWAYIYRNTIHWYHEFDKLFNQRFCFLVSLVSTDYFGGNQVVHAEVQEVLLLTGNDGCDLVTSSSVPPNFGIQLQGSVFATESVNPLISFIEPDRAADRW